jgi:hypothetical protein
MGILQIKKKRANGHPTIHYRLDREKLNDSLMIFLRTKPKDLKNRNLNISDSITKTTQKTTQENTTNISFKEYKKKSFLKEETIEVIEYFLRQYEQFRGKAHPNLKHSQWGQLVETFFQYVDEDGAVFALSIDELKAKIDQHFTTACRESDNCSIIHFNNSSVKLRRIHEVAY